MWNDLHVHDDTRRKLDVLRGEAARRRDVPKLCARTRLACTLRWLVEQLEASST